MFDCRNREGEFRVGVGDRTRIFRLLSDRSRLTICSPTSFHVSTNRDGNDKKRYHSRRWWVWLWDMPTLQLPNRNFQFRCLHPPIDGIVRIRFESEKDSMTGRLPEMTSESAIESVFHPTRGSLDLDFQWRFFSLHNYNRNERTCGGPVLRDG